MSSTARPAFVRRPNRERRIESVCSRCKAVVATSQARADLDRAEREHLCEARSLASRKKPPQPESQARGRAARTDAA